MRALALAVIAVAAAACGDDLALPPLTGPIAARLAALPGVTVQEYQPQPGDQLDPRYRYFDLWFEQPVDRDDPDAGTFAQHASLMHVSDDAPLVVVVGGYDIYAAHTALEPTYYTGANQLSLEYRFYGTSKPATLRWTDLDVAAAQLDQHAVVQDMERVYPGAHRIVTGGSKGGENALQSMRMFPDDYDGAVAYVPPVMTDMPDLRYAHVLDDIGLADCRDRLRALQRALLGRRASMEAHAIAQGYTYDHVGLGKAVETAIVELEFGFWMEQTQRVLPAQCLEIPDDTASDDELYFFLDHWSPPRGYSDQTEDISTEQYTYQFMSQLGYPIWEHAHLDDLMQYSYEDWTPCLPVDVATPAYDPSTPRDLARWIASDADHIMIVGGEWDPWGAGYPASVPAGRDAHRFIAPQASHWSAGIYSLVPADYTEARAVLSRWSGTPLPSMATGVAPTPAFRRGVHGGVLAAP